ncbi:MAG TPA: hypothetical protein VMV93_13730 [Chloroflexota bacterium]|nr:hypothetical protein [Chloroflexota bacterium]
MRGRGSVTPVGVVIRGLVAGAMGTLAMDGLWYVRYRAGGGHSGFGAWEFSAGLTWDQAGAPAQVGKRLAEGFLQRPLPATAAPLTNNVVHWGYGMLWGALFGLVAGSARRQRLVFGPLFGALVWLSSYVSLPAAGLYKPLWEYDRQTLAKDLSAHLTYGAATGAVLRLLLGRR